MNTSNMPQGVINDINDAKALFMDEERIEGVDPQYNRIVDTLEDIVKKQVEEEKELSNDYLFNQEEFIDSLEHVVKDQLSALKKETLSPAEFAERFNRWFIFCDAVANLGITCLYSKDALKMQDYETVFKSLQISKQFETTFLKPRGITVKLTHKNPEIKTKYPWLAMPCLVIKDEQGTEHLIAITPSPFARVWWLDILSSFHNSYQWAMENQLAQEDFDAAPYPTIESYNDSASSGAGVNGFDGPDEEQKDEDEISPDYARSENEPSAFDNDGPETTTAEPEFTSPVRDECTTTTTKANWFQQLVNWVKNLFR